MSFSALQSSGAFAYLTLFGNLMNIPECFKTQQIQGVKSAAQVAGRHRGGPAPAYPIPVVRVVLVAAQDILKPLVVVVVAERAGVAIVVEELPLLANRDAV
jgi:hypothetical protein